MAQTINRDFFFDRVKLHLLGGAIKATQLSGLTAILDEWEKRQAKNDDRWLGYMLGTVHHETDRTFKPIKEYGSKKRFLELYDVSGRNPARARRNGNTEVGDGPKFCGRGFVQLTWKNNYAAMSRVCGVDLVDDPDAAMDLAVATKVLFHGMINGTFTGKKLKDYFNPSKADFVNARRIINGLDKANLIAEYSKSYYAAISYTT